MSLDSLHSLRPETTEKCDFSGGITDEQTDRQMDRLMDWQMEWQMEEQTDGQTLLEKCKDVSRNRQIKYFAILRYFMVILVFYGFLRHVNLKL